MQYRILERTEPDIQGRYVPQAKFLGLFWGDLYEGNFETIKEATDYIEYRKAMYRGEFKPQVVKIL